MSEKINEAEVQRALHFSSDVSTWRRISRNFTLAELDYAIERHGGLPGFSSSLFKAEWAEQSRREMLERMENERMAAQMAALRAELVKTQEKIEAGRHIADETARAEEAERIAVARHAENVRLTRRAIRWAIWATLVGVLGVLFPLLSRWLGQD